MSYVKKVIFKRQLIFIKIFFGKVRLKSKLKPNATWG